MMQRSTGLLLGMVSLALTLALPSQARATCDLANWKWEDCCQLPGSNAGDWPMFGRDLCHTSSNPSSTITRDNAALLQRAWFFPTGDTVHSSPTVVGGVVYIGSWDGNFYALDAETGLLKWKFEVDCDFGVRPVPPRCLAQLPVDKVADHADRPIGPDDGLIGGSATVVNGRVYFGAGRTFYSVDATQLDEVKNPDLTPKPKLHWKTLICGNPDAPNCDQDMKDHNRLRPSPIYFEGSIFVGFTMNGADGGRGGFLKIKADPDDPQTPPGTIQKRFETDYLMDDDHTFSIDANGVPHGTVQTRGCGGVWSSAAVDAVNKVVVFGTADCGFEAEPPFHEAIIALNTADLSVAWYYRPRPTDGCDFDFGASPNVIDLDRDNDGVKERYIGEGGKDGYYYLLKAMPAGVGADKLYPPTEVVWTKQVVHGGLAGGFVSAGAFDGARIFGGTAFGELGGAPCHPDEAGTVILSDDGKSDTFFQEPTLHAFNAKTGDILWQQKLNTTFSAPAVNNQVLFVANYMTPTLRAYDAGTGNLLTVLPMPSAVHSEPALVGNMLFVGSGVSYNPQGSGVHAFRLLPIP